MAQHKIATTAAAGFQNALSYDAHRPSYPTEAVESLLEHLEVRGIQYSKVIDLAAGTGIFTELLAAHPDKYETLAVEPHPQMREVLQMKDLQGVTVMDGIATDMVGVENGWADAVVAAQAFHWFANFDALREIHRVLVPGGVLGLVWNEEDYGSPTDITPATDWERRIRDVVWAMDQKQNGFHVATWPRIFDNQLLFSKPLNSESFRWTVWLSRQEFWARFRTMSFIASLDEDEKDAVKREVYRILDEADGDDLELNRKGEIAVHGRTLVYWTTAIPY